MPNTLSNPNQQPVRLTRRGIGAVMVAGALLGGGVAAGASHVIDSARRDNHMYEELTKPDVPQQLQQGKINLNDVKVVTAGHYSTASGLADELSNGDSREMTDEIVAQAGVDIQPGEQIILAKKDLANNPPEAAHSGK